MGNDKSIQSKVVSLIWSQMNTIVWSVSDLLLKGGFTERDYGRIILPFVLLRRLECVLEPTREIVASIAQAHTSTPELVRDLLLKDTTGEAFYNASNLSLGRLSSTQTAQDLLSYINAFSTDAREVFEKFKFEDYIHQLGSSNLLYKVVEKFAAIDLSPDTLSNYDMGLVFEQLICQFAERSEKTTGEHFTMPAIEALQILRMSFRSS